MTMGWCQSRSAILIVDDSASSRCYLSELLNGANCQVREARDGHECLAALAASTPDVVLLDVEMPGKNGIEVLQEIGLTPRLFSIILLTTRSGKEQIAAGFDLGADDYIVKPFQDVDLLASIRAAVRTSRQMRALAEARQETETALARLKKLQYRLVEDEKIAAVARLAAGAAHHINNPLGFVMSNLATLNRYANSLLGFVGELTCELLLNAQQAEGAIRDMERAHRIVQIRKDLTPLLNETHEGTQRIALIVQQMAQLELGLAQQNMSELELVTLLQPLVGIVADLAPPDAGA
jgi:two-component system, NtrC family, sensor kinase